MRNLLLLGTLSFTIAFSCGLVVEKNVTKSAAIGAIDSISTLSSGLVLSKISEQERQKLQGQTEKLKNLESEILIFFMISSIKIMCFCASFSANKRSAIASIIT